MSRCRTLTGGAIACAIALTCTTELLAGGGVPTRDDAIAEFLGFIAGDANQCVLDAFIPPAPLLPGDTLGPHQIGPPQLITDPSWLVFIDDAPTAAFSHPVRYLLIDVNDGGFTQIDADFHPAVNGVPLYFENPVNRYADGGDAILIGENSLMPPMSPGFENEPAAPVKEPTTWGVVIGGPDVRDGPQVDKAVGALRTNPGIDEKKIKSAKNATKDDVCKALEAVKGCDKLYFVLITHGSNEDIGSVAKWSVQLKDGWYPVKDLVAKLKATGAGEFCILIHTCFSGCFLQQARGQLDGEIAVSSTRSKESWGWTFWNDNNGDGMRQDGEITRHVWHYLEEFLTCLKDPAKGADMAPNGDGDGTVEWEEAHKWAKTIIETPSGTNGQPGSGSETDQGPMYEEIYAFDTFLWSGGQGTSGAGGCTKLDLYNPSCTETRQVDWTITLPGPSGLTEADGVGIVDQMGTETLGPKEKKTIKINFTFPDLPNGGIIFPKATVTETGSGNVIGCNTGCVRVPIPQVEPAIDNVGESTFMPPDDVFPPQGQLEFAVEVRDLNLVGMPLDFQVVAINENPEDDVVFDVFPPNFQIIFPAPFNPQPVIINVQAPPGTSVGTANEIRVEYVGALKGIGPGPQFASLGAIVGPAVPQGDCNFNGVPDQNEIDMGFEQDCNGNGVPDQCDIAIGFSTDCNGNTVPDECEIDFVTDQNGDGILDQCQDCQPNGTLDPVDIASGTSQDCDGNGVPDECQIPQDDCNFNGIPDLCDLATGAAQDCNGNNLPDSCDIAANPTSDGNGDGVPDECQDCNGNGQLDPQDIADGLELDCNDNDVPDSCEVGTLEDCNGNGIPDSCEPSLDCNLNGLPDFCELLDADCNGNGIPDSCDILSGFAIDANTNGVPDDCETNDPCLGDIDGDNNVGFTDLNIVLSNWGPCPRCPHCPGDLDGDGNVGFTDLNIVLGAWGPCP